MFRALLICTAVSACVMGCAGTSQPRQDAKTARTDRACVASTESRIPPTPGQCSFSPGRSISAAELDQTGQPLVETP